jgi:hypothetical protein
MCTLRAVVVSTDSGVRPCGSRLLGFVGLVARPGSLWWPPLPDLSRAAILCRCRT